MWTNTNGWHDKSKEFVVNHFVPLVKEIGESSWNNLGGTKFIDEDGWQLVTKRKKGGSKTLKRKVG
jgi:hypothetical protein